MAQQTAVKWLKNKFQKFLSYYEGNHKAEPYTIEELSNDFAQAKQMEREQIENAYDKISMLTAEEYYNETYGTRLQNETNSTQNKIPPPPTPPPSRFLKEGKEPPKRNQLK